MDMSRVNTIWSNKPKCNLPVVEVWIDDKDLWFVMFVDDNDRTMKIEMFFPPLTAGIEHIIDYMEVERLMEAAKRDLIIMANNSGVELKTG